MWGMTNATDAFFGPAPFDTLGKLLEPTKTVSATVDGQRKQFAMNLSDTNGAALYFPTGNLNGLNGIRVRPFTRVNYVFRDFESAQQAVAKVNRAVRALYEADTALNGQRELTEDEIMRIIATATGVSPLAFQIQQ